MNRIVKALATAVAGATLLTGAASAATNECSITDTGTLSSNTCTLNLNTVDKVTCNNDIYVRFENDQQATSGYGVVVDNTNGGGAHSGDVSNQNIVVGKIGASCGTAPAATPVAVVTPTPAATPVAGRGAETGTAAAKAVPKAASLPDTGSNTVVIAAVAGVALLAGGTAFSQVGVSAFRRGSLK